MEIWLDSVNIQAVKLVKRLGFLSGVTTNPSLIAQQTLDYEKILEALLHYQEGPVTAQVCAPEAAEMVQQGQNLYAISNRIIIKVPMTKEGLDALHSLSRQGIPTMATIIVHPHQALMAALAGARYVAPYLGAIEKAGFNPWEMLQSCVKIFNNYRLSTKILAASLLSIEHVLKCAEAGIYGVTLKESLFQELMNTDPYTNERNEAFAEDWKKIDHHELFSEKIRR